MTQCERLIAEGIFSKDFFKEEVRNDFLVDTTRKKVWAIELDLYKRFSGACDKYGLRYWVAFGTLLGTIRHDGFIPWDDDFDVCMPREDYEKLTQIAEKEFEHPYFFQTTLNDTDYYSAFARLRNSNTTGILNVSRNNKCNNGIFMDIFPFDNAPNNKMVQNWRQFINHSRNVLAHAYVYNVNPSRIARTANKILHSRLVRFDPRKQYVKVNQYAQKSPNTTGYIGMMAFPGKYNAHLVFRKDYFRETIYHKFENFEVPVPIGYDSILKERYGEYMEFPPVSARGNWHDFIFAPDVPYVEYERTLFRNNRGGGTA